MGVFNLIGMTVKSLFTAAPTRKYPYEKREPYPRTRGGVEMLDIKGCIYCGMCVKKCPANCIKVDKAEETWSHNPWMCIACDSCVRSCPKNVLGSVNAAPPITTAPEWQTVKRPPLTAEEQAEKERKEAEKKAKIEAALKAKREREAQKQNGEDAAE